MSYLGRGLEQVDNISKLDNITFNGGTTYALTKDSAAFTPISSNAILISVSGVIQQGNFSVSGTNIVFNFSPTGSNTCDFIMHYGTGVAFTPADSSITKDKTDFISTSSSSGLQIKGDGTTDGTLQLNCSQNSHGVKIKSPAHSAGQSYTLTLPTTSPATDKMLQTDSSGNLSFVDAPSGALVKLVQAHSLSDVSVVNVDSIFSSIYSAYRLVGTFKTTNSNVNARFRWRASSSDLSVSQYYGSGRGGYKNGSSEGVDNFSEWGSSYATIAHGINNNNYNALQLDILLYPYNNTGAGNIGSINNASSFIFAVNYWRDASPERQEQISGGYTYTQTTVADGFALYPTAGDWDGYNYAVFGYKG